MSNKPKLYYVHDPMCSWCWGYKPVWQQIENQLSPHVDIVYVAGGLAPDSAMPMPQEMQQQIASYWKKIENLLGTRFNYDFWTQNTPRRSTYPACRALLAAREQDAELAMLAAIQSAYYLNAKNPSNDDVLLGLAFDLGLNTDEFSQTYTSSATQKLLLDEISFARSIGGNSFPSLFLYTESKCQEDKHQAGLLQGRIRQGGTIKDNTYLQFDIDYQNAAYTVSQILKSIT